MLQFITVFVYETMFSAARESLAASDFPRIESGYSEIILKAVVFMISTRHSVARKPLQEAFKRPPREVHNMSRVRVCAAHIGGFLGSE